MTKRFVILSAEHERIRNTLRGKRIATVALLLRNDRTIAYCTYLTAFVETKRLVILSAKRERIRSFLNIFKYNTVVIPRK